MDGEEVKKAVIDQVRSLPLGGAELILHFEPGKDGQWRLIPSALAELKEAFGAKSEHELLGRMVIVNDKNDLEPYREEKATQGKQMERANAVIAGVELYHGYKYDWSLVIFIEGYRGTTRLHLTSKQLSEITARWGEVEPEKLLNKKIVIDREVGGEWYYVGLWEGGPEGDNLLKLEEDRILNLLSQAYNHFLELPPLHPNDQAEFTRAIHQAQNIVMSRPVMRRARG